MRITLDSVDSTLNLGAQLGNRLQAGDLVILSGSLGAGKTTLTKGIAAGMGVSGRVTSPTFVIARIHRPTVRIETAPGPRKVPLVHVDAYRLAGAIELDDLDLDTDLDAAAVVVEWGEGVAEQLSSRRLLVELERLPDDTRVARLTPFGGSWRARLTDVVEAWASATDSRVFAADPATPYGSR
jgi:tRNA threonylcarbamoyladenosine biosynthesis protein TsaE